MSRPPPSLQQCGGACQGHKQACRLLVFRRSIVFSSPPFGSTSPSSRSSPPLTCESCAEAATHNQQPVLKPRSKSTTGCQRCPQPQKSSTQCSLFVGRRAAARPPCGRRRGQHLRQSARVHAAGAALRRRHRPGQHGADWGQRTARGAGAPGGPAHRGDCHKPRRLCRRADGPDGEAVGTLRGQKGRAAHGRQHHPQGSTLGWKFHGALPADRLTAHTEDLTSGRHHRYSLQTLTPQGFPRVTGAAPPSPPRCA